MFNVEENLLAFVISVSLGLISLAVLIDSVGQAISEKRAMTAHRGYHRRITHWGRKRQT